ncbi:MAG: hypothetical protein HYW45_02405 [Candidatus Daviesbacteria bacterium]|nr:MAG: hypothetical protein HYW45_02405 [Candidatus Daviesbacteria bacterium]
MFHNTHVYIASKLYNSADELLLVGSILPDLAVTGIIQWEGGLHGKESVKSFFQFIQGNSTYLNLYKGVYAHNILDDFTHQNYQGEPGFAYQNNKELVQLVKRFYDLDDKGAAGKAHNYIESGVDILLLKEHPEVQNQFRKAINQVDKPQLAYLLSAYFKVDEAKFLVAILQFFELFTKYDFSKQENWVLFWQDLEKLLVLKDIGDKNRKVLIDKSLEIVKNTYQDFLNYSLTEGVKQV